LYQLNRSRGFSLFFSPVRFASTQLASSPPIPFPSVASPLADVITPPHCVTLPSHWVKMSSLPSLHLPATLCSVASPLEPKLKHWIRTTATGYPPRTARLPPSTVIKRSSQPCHSLHHSTVSPFYLLPSPSTTPSELHMPPSFPLTVVSCPSSLRTTTHTVMNYLTLFRFPDNLLACEFT
jgi:hypothetical protein